MILKWRICRKYVPTTPYSMYNNTKASPRAAVVLELPGSTRTWRRVRLASQLTLRRSEQLIPVVKHSPLSVSNHHNYAPSSWADWSWTFSHGGKQKEFLHLTWLCVVADSTRQTCTIHPSTYIYGQGSNLCCSRTKRCLLPPRMLESTDSLCVISMQRPRRWPYIAFILQKSGEWLVNCAPKQNKKKKRDD